jgi:hypothetical protein
MVFEITEPSGTATLIMGGLTVLLLVLALGIGWITVSLSSPSVTLSEDNLGVRLPMYGREISLSKLKVDEARVVDLRTEEDLKPRIRTNGIGLPGYQVGWFRLVNGEKALIGVTARDRVLYVPTTEGYSLMFSLAQAEELIEKLSPKK